MFLSLFVMLFLLIMMAMWAHFGFFSAFMHLIVTIIAGALALALWEPITMGLLMGMFQPEYAWPVGLLVPFAVFLIVLRFVADRFVRGNLDLHYMTNIIGGAFFGLLAGILASGLTVFGLSFMPDALSGLGYVPVIIDNNGAVIQKTSLVPAVDRWTIGFYSRMSGGSFYSGYPIELYHNDPIGQAQRYEVRIDQGETAIGTTPDSVSVTGVSTAVATTTQPVSASSSVMGRVGTKLQEKGKKLVIVSTLWEKAGGVFNVENVLLNPAQLSLVTWNQSKTAAKQYPPLGVAYVVTGEDRGKKTEIRTFYPFDSEKVVAKGVGDKVSFDIAFMIDEDQVPEQLLVRHLRIAIDEVQEKPADPVVALGDIASDAKVEKEALDPRNIEVNASLPEPISKNMGNQLEYDGTHLVGGTQDVNRPQGPMSNETRVLDLSVGQDNVIVRIKLNAKHMDSMFGRTVQAANATAPIYIKYAGDPDVHSPIGFIWRKGNEPVQVIKIDRTSSRRMDTAMALGLPLGQINEKDEVYIYFAVPANTKIVAYCMGSEGEKPLDPPLETKKPATP